MNTKLWRLIEARTGMSMEQIIDIVHAVSAADFSDERHVRKVIRKVGRMTGKPISQQTEDQLTQSILQGGNGLTIDHIEQMLK
ncbi:stage VI sporulation protein F [Chryseomicrobium sp. FSL W7-1435]|uniref:stage VI sporulation protein F n=1 Tax=Chryseomicrobium sp. FSL W7-1435 TaxID=2921704 RepID=UPI003159BC95